MNSGPPPQAAKSERWRSVPFSTGNLPQAAKTHGRLFLASGFPVFGWQGYSFALTLASLAAQPSKITQLNLLPRRQAAGTGQRAVDRACKRLRAVARICR